MKINIGFTDIKNKLEMEEAEAILIAVKEVYNQADKSVTVTHKVMPEAPNVPPEPVPTTEIRQSAEPAPAPKVEAAMAASQDPAPVTAVPTSAPEYTLDDLARAAQTVMDGGKQEQLIGLLAKFGVRSLPELDPSSFGAFATDLRSLGAKI